MQQQHSNSHLNYLTITKAPLLFHTVDDRTTAVRSPVRQENFPFSKMTRPDMTAKQPPVRMSVESKAVVVKSKSSATNWR
jgi:hypothetical protein